MILQQLIFQFLVYQRFENEIVSYYIAYHCQYSNHSVCRYMERNICNFVISQRIFKINVEFIFILFRLAENGFSEFRAMIDIFHKL